jgi:hypothetical protein
MRCKGKKKLIKTEDSVFIFGMGQLTDTALLNP